MEKKLTQEEINSLSPRARQQYDSTQPLQEILDVNPNADLIEQEELKQEIKKKIKGKKK
jgi:hypothetical protein|tara:strand:+ start:761 stop:937 length:177 start_codon:yes stop_codon:yes gene_type:complete